MFALKTHGRPDRRRCYQTSAGRRRNVDLRRRDEYKEEKTPLMIFAGQEYGTGSSRDWAAKGTAADGREGRDCQSFERIHRSNLVGMGVLPLQFKDGQSAATLGLDGTETFDLVGLENVPVRPHAGCNAEDQASRWFKRRNDRRIANRHAY